MKAFTAGSLFSGIGGIDAAFAAVGFDIRFQVEVDEFCRKVLAKHGPNYWPNAAQFVDVRDVGRNELGYVDVLFGGFPCQDISLAGNGAGLEGARSGLWYEFRRIIGEIRPRVVFLENVPAITSRGGTTFIAHLAALGYDARWGIVSAADAGAPHQRDRWFCVAYAGGVRLEARANQPDGIRETQFAHATGGGDVAEVAYPAGAGWRAGLRLRAGTPHLSRANAPEIGGANRQGTVAGACASAGHRGERRDGAAQPRVGGDADGLSSWLDGHRWPAGSGQPQHDYEPPRITNPAPNRSARIKALGNAVVPQVIYPFALEIIKGLKS